MRPDRHPRLRDTEYAERALAFLPSFERRRNIFVAFCAVARLGSATARKLRQKLLPEAASRQRGNGSFGTRCVAERVVAVLGALDSKGLDSLLPHEVVHAHACEDDTRGPMHRENPGTVIHRRFVLAAQRDDCDAIYGGIRT